MFWSVTDIHNFSLEVHFPKYTAYHIYLMQCTYTKQHWCKVYTKKNPIKFKQADFILFLTYKTCVHSKQIAEDK
jgi:hypothetical protein